MIGSASLCCRSAFTNRGGSGISVEILPTSNQEKAPPTATVYLPRMKPIPTAHQPGIQVGALDPLTPSQVGDRAPQPQHPVVIAR